MTDKPSLAEIALYKNLKELRVKAESQERRIEQYEAAEVTERAALKETLAAIKELEGMSKRAE